MYKIGEEEMVICPYNNQHVVSKLRIQTHIIKCQKNNSHIKLATCFYNYSHRIKPEDLLAHYEICPNKTRIDGARYCEFTSRPSSAASQNDLPQRNIPDIHTKTHFFRDSPILISSLNEECEEDSQKLETSGSESDIEDFHLKSDETNSFFNDENIDDDDDDDEEEEEEESNEEIVHEKNYNDEEEDNDLEPLPLPKTVSKAFVYSKEHTSKPLTVKPYQAKPFGRGKSLVAFSPPKEQRRTDHLLPDLSDMDNDLPKRENTPRFFSKNLPCSYNASVVSSSMIDDTATLQSGESGEIIYDDEFENDDNNGFILKNFDKYTKI